jgi:hypothetical protein
MDLHTGTARDTVASLPATGMTPPAHVVNEHASRIGIRISDSRQQLRRLAPPNISTFDSHLTLRIEIPFLNQIASMPCRS